MFTPSQLGFVAGAQPRRQAMALASNIDDDLRVFLRESAFLTSGAVVTDLDGTAVHEFEGRIAIPDPVSHGLKHLNDLGRPVVLNTLRFPLNVMASSSPRVWAPTYATRFGRPAIRSSPMKAARCPGA
jgi:hypothetical protein